MGAELQKNAPSQPYRPGPLLRWASRRFFGDIQVDEKWTQRVRESARGGVVVYVMRSLSFLDFFCLHALLSRFALPLVRFVNDLGLGVFEPFGKGIRRMRLKKQQPEDRALSDVVTKNGSALLFLRRPPRFGRRSRRGGELDTDLIRTLIEAQRRMDKALLLQPQTFVWNLRPPSQKRGFVDLFFGPIEWPGRIRTFFQFLFNYRNVRLRSGEALDLRAFMAERLELTDGQMADKVRYALLRIMERERRLVVGPTKKTTGRIKEELLRSPRVRTHILGRARSEGKSEARIQKEARRMLGRLAADQQPWMLGFLGRFLGWVFRRIYDGIVVDEEGVGRVRDAARDGTLVFLPSHKSHVDYLVLSYVLHKRALAPPLIAAGENLSFFPLGPFLRRGGAFFIKRSFRGKRLYAALVDAYMRKLLATGHAMEFFIEGGRSRTGKLLTPKLGLLSMVIDAAAKTPLRDVKFVPVSIGYERIVEERSYVHEMSGGQKESESVGGLLRTPKVLRSKYGRLYVQFGEILSFEELQQGRDLQKPKDKRALVQELAHRVSYEINRVTVVTPAALVATTLLAHRRRAMSEGDLYARSATVLESLESAGAECAVAIRDSKGELRRDTLKEAVALFLDAGLIRRASGDAVVYQVPDQRRMALEYYKNNVLHFFVPRALTSAILLKEHSPLGRAQLEAQMLRLSRAFKYEFMYRADAPLSEILDSTLSLMIAEGDIEERDGGYRCAGGKPGERARLHAEMLRSYLECYRLALRSCQENDAMMRKEWLKRSVDWGQRMYLAGEIELREAISHPKLEGALRAFKDLGLLRIDRGRIQVVDEDGIRALHEELGALLNAL